MKHFIFLILTLLLIFQGCLTRKASRFSLNDHPVVVMEKDGADLFQYWEFEDHPALWSRATGKTEHLDRYKDSLELILGKDPFKGAVQKEATWTLPFQQADTANGDRFNAMLVHSGTAGRVLPIGLLEAQLLNYQMGRYPMIGHPTEFHGFILRHDSLNRVRVYFGSGDQPWPPKPWVIFDAVEQDLKKGWRLYAHLHNHYEPKSNNYIGIMAPSMADAQFYKMLEEEFRVEKAMITNGFHTVHIPAEEFGKFFSH